MLDREIWLPMYDFPAYDCSNFGRIRNHKTGRIMKQWVNTRGYKQIALRKNGVQHIERVHRLIAATFHPVDNMDVLDVNHIDGNKLNNDADNLEWCTRSENIRHGMRIGLIKTNDFGKTRRPVRIIETGEEFDSLSKCARLLKTTPSDIVRCVEGQIKSVKGYHFELI